MKMLLALIAQIFVVHVAFGQYVLPDSQVQTIMNAQNDSIPRYSDYHFHGTNMGYYNKIPDPRLIGSGGFTQEKIKDFNWTGVRKPINNKKGNNAKNYGQADYGMLESANARIICNSISPIEKNFTSDFLKRIINSGFVTRIKYKRIKKTNQKSSYDEFIGERDYMLAQDTVDPYHKSIVIKPVRNKAELIENFKRGNTSVLLSLEGGHIFDGDITDSSDINERGIFTERSQQEILRNIDAIKSQPYRVFFVTLGHFAWNGIVGFCKTLDENKRGLRGTLFKYSKHEGFRIWLFKKYGDGIITKTYANPPKGRTCTDNRDTFIVNGKKDTTSFGYKVIKRLLDTTGNKYPLYIDVKHMDIKARFDYYKFLKDNNINVPIICSHAGVSGKSRAVAEFTGLYPNFDIYEEVKSPYDIGDFNIGCLKSRNLQYNMDDLGWYYPWSLNLADEEIPVIYQSDGIIGITLDERILGKGRPNYEKAEFKNKLKAFCEARLLTKAEIDTFSEMQPLFKNIFHIVEQSNYPGRPDLKSWEHIALGTDFDGFIKPVSYCHTAAEIPALWKLLVKYLPLYEEFIYNDPGHTILCNLTAKQIADNIIFKNGERFALKYF